MRLYVAELGCHLGSTSPTAMAVATGVVTFTVAGGPLPVMGLGLTLERQAAPEVTLTGNVTAVERATSTVTMAVRSAAGAGTHSDWLLGDGVLRVSDGDGYRQPSGPGPFVPVITRLPSLRRSMAGFFTTDMNIAEEWRALAINNEDNAYGALAGYGWQDLALYRVDHDAPWSSRLLVFAAALGDVTFPSGEVSFELLDCLRKLEEPLQEAKFAGDNVGPTGLEGTAEDGGGQTKPLFYGRPFNCPLPTANRQLNIHQISTAAGDIVSPTGGAAGCAFDRGVALSAGADYGTATELSGTPPVAPVGYRVLPAGPSYVRTTSPPAGQLTADLLEGATALDRRAHRVMLRMALTRLAVSDVAEEDIEALDAVVAGEVGYWLDGDETVKDAMARVGRGNRLLFGFDRFGKLRFTRRVAPAGPPVARFRRLTGKARAKAGDIDILDVELVSQEQPVRAMDYLWKRTWHVQTSDLDANITAERRALITEQWRKIHKTAAIERKYRRARTDVSVESLIVEAGPAGAEAQAILDLLSVRRDTVRVTAPLTDALIEAVDIGKTVLVEDETFLDYGAGRLIAVEGLDYDPDGDRVVVEGWG